MIDNKILEELINEVVKSPGLHSDKILDNAMILKAQLRQSYINVEDYEPIDVSVHGYYRKNPPAEIVSNIKRQYCQRLGLELMSLNLIEMEIVELENEDKYIFKSKVLRKKREI